MSSFSGKRTTWLRFQIGRVIRKLERAIGATRIAGRELLFERKALKAAARARLRTIRHDQHVVFVSNVPHIREVKLAQGLMQTGWRVTLLYRDKPNFDLTGWFSDVERYGGPWEALWLASQHAPLVYHLFSLSGDPETTLFTVEKPGPTIYDANDIFEGLIPIGATDKEKNQRTAFEHADALCCRDLQYKAYLRSTSARRNRNLIWYPEYCWAEADLPSLPEDEVHVVSAGVIPLERLDGGRGFLEIARHLAKHDVHFHIYPTFLWHSVPASRFEYAFGDYIELGRTTGRVHVHKCLPATEVVAALKRHDVGLLVVPALLQTEKEESILAEHSQTLESARNSGSARLSDYLDAGLAVIANRELRLGWFISARYSVAVDAEFLLQPNIREILLAARDNTRLKRSRLALYSLSANTERLADFYRRQSELHAKTLNLDS